MAVIKAKDSYEFIYELKDVVILATSTLQYKGAREQRYMFGHVFLVL